MSPESAMKAYEQRGYPLIDKPPIGSWGRLVSLIRDDFEGKTIVEHREMMGNSALKIHIVQEYIRYKNRDIRCIVIGDGLLGCYARNIQPNEWRANVALGGVPSPLDLDEKLISVSTAAAKTVGGEFVSIDILEHPSRGLRDQRDQRRSRVQGLHVCNGNKRGREAGGLRSDELREIIEPHFMASAMNIS
jgi:glutamate--LysW ligase ArgX